MKKVVIPLMICSFLCLLYGCKSDSEEVKLTSGINLANLDTTASPNDDFYQYACGGWMKNNPLKPEYSRYGSFDVLGENNQIQLKEIITEAASKQHEQGSVAQKIGDLYNIGMDTVTIEKQGAEPIQNELQAIADMKDKSELTSMLAEMSLNGLSPFFGIFGEADPDNSSMNIAWLWQSGLGIGDRDYYLKDDQQNLRDQYLVMLTEYFKLSGYSKMVNMEGRENELATSVLSLETAMAEKFMDKNMARDPFKTHNIRTIDQLQSMIPAVDMKAYLNAQGLGHLESVNVGQVDYISALNNILTICDLNTIKAYLASKVIGSAAPYLSQQFVDANFNFYGKARSGQEENKPRWKRVVGTVDACLGEAVGQLYVEKYFPAAAKDRMLNLVNNLKLSLSERIQNADWMSDSTKMRAQEKLSAIIVKIGYPEKWRDYSKLEIKNDSYYANVVRARRFENEYQMSKIGKPVDPTEWQMTPQTVNAYYNPTTNEICFPAGILQPPFFDMNSDDAANYGAIGVVIGHEMTHGFDDQGRNYDKMGNLSNWWTEEDGANFTRRAQVLVDFFNKIEVAPGLYANGQFTLGENIADNGGLNISYQALQKAKAEGGIQEEMDGFTANQRFFLAYANVWANNIRDEEIVHRTTEDPHSLGKYRVNATLPHIDGFIEAFNIKPGDKMYVAPEERAHIW